MLREDEKLILLSPLAMQMYAKNFGKSKWVVVEICICLPSLQ
jgi:hypothetical protein